MSLRRALLALLFGCSAVGGAAAQEPPALQGASAQEKARVSALIDGAKKEGALTYWDVVIQPETNDALTAAFRKRYGLPNSFQVNYQLTATAGLVTRVEQEINANRVTIDVAAVGSPPWVFERAAAGDALDYDSPEYKYFADAFKRGLGKPGVFAFNGAYLFVPMWSTDLLKFEGKSWRLRESAARLAKQHADAARTRMDERRADIVNDLRPMAVLDYPIRRRSARVLGRRPSRLPDPATPQGRSTGWST